MDLAYSSTRTKFQFPVICREVEPGKRYIVDLGLNQTDLASMIGARREWVNRILSDWKRRGLLEFNNGEIAILDLPRVVAERDVDRVGLRRRVRAASGRWTVRRAAGCTSHQAGRAVDP